MNNEKLVLISSHCDTSDKLKVLKTNLDILKKLDVKILLYSSVNLDKDIISLADYYFYNSINPISESRGLLFWKEDIYNNKKIKFCKFWKDNALPVFYQLKYLTQISKMFNFELNYFMLYDLLMSNDVIDFIKNQNKEGFFSFMSSENGIEIQNDCATQLYCVSGYKLNDLDSYFSWEDCQKFSCSEHFMSDIANKLNIPINRDFVIEDHVYTFRNWTEDFYNFSPYKEFKIYFSKNAGTDEEPSMMIYDINKPVDIFIRINDDVKKVKIEDIQIYEIKKEYQKFELWLNGKIFDVLESVSKFSGGTWEII